MYRGVCLPRSAGDRRYETSRVEPGLVVDVSRRGSPIGLEITAPAKRRVSALNKVLRALGQPAVTPADLAPLRAAWRWHWPKLALQPTAAEPADG